MKIFKFSTIILVIALFVGYVSAESLEDNAADNQCSEVYDACLAECDKSQDGSEKCYKTCEEQYSNCPIGDDENKAGQ